MAFLQFLGYQGRTKVGVALVNGRDGTIGNAYAVLLRFIKDVAQYGPTEDLLGGAGDLPKEFEELMRGTSVGR